MQDTLLEGTEQSGGGDGGGGRGGVQSRSADARAAETVFRYLAALTVVTRDRRHLLPPLGRHATVERRRPAVRQVDTNDRTNDRKRVYLKTPNSGGRIT